VEVLLSTAYFPPAEYFSAIKLADRILIEKEENYIKQTYRNRCRILSSAGILSLSVPVMKGPFLKAPVGEIVIDYSKRWQQVHLRAFKSSYGTSPYFQYYFETIEKAILGNHKYLIDLNYELLSLCLDMVRIQRSVAFTSSFEPHEEKESDFRYLISPKKTSSYSARPYFQVFAINGFVPNLSILDLLFNMGPESAEYL
jgi:WbqC-like protein family